MSEEQLLKGLLEREGWPKVTNHPADRGGLTKGGITLEAWQAVHTGATAEDLEAITEEEAIDFYRERYILEPHYDRIEDLQLRELLVDAGVNHGTGQATKWVQSAAKVTQDGALGPISLAAINAAAPLELFLWVCAFRARLYGRLTSSDPQLAEARAQGLHLQAEFTAGWANRLAGFLEGAARQIEAQHQRGLS